MFLTMVSTYLISSPLSSIYIHMSKKPKFWIAFAPMLLPIFIFIWALLPYNERFVIFEDTAKASKMDNKMFVYYTFNGRLYTKQIEEDKEYKFVYYNEDAGYGRRYDKDYDFVTK